MRTGLRTGRMGMIGAAAAALIAWCAPANARPLTVEDLLGQESFGTVAFDPSGRWMVYERRVARTRAASFAMATRHEVVENQIRIVDVPRGSAPRALIRGDPIGITLGPFSPDGGRLAIYGYRAGRWELGVVTVASGAVRWLGLDAEFPYRERTVQWRSARELIAIARPSGSLPLILRINSVGPQELPGRWARVARGETAVTVIGSGRYLDVRPRRSPGRLVAVDVASGRQRTLAEGDISDLEIAPGGRRLAFTEAGADIRLTADQSVHGPNGTALRRLRLGIVDLETGVVTRPAAEFDLAGQLLSWSPSGRELLVFGRRDGQDWTQGQLLRVGEDGRAAVLSLGAWQPVLQMRPEAARAAWVGETPALLARRGARRDWIALSDDEPTVLTANLRTAPDRLSAVGGRAFGVADGRAWWLTVDGAAPLALSAVRLPPERPLWEARLLANPPEPQTKAALQRQAAWGSEAVVVGRDGAGPGVSLPGRDSRLAAVAASGGALATLTDDDHGVGRLHLFAAGRWRLIDRINSGQQDVDPLRAVAVTAREGERVLQSWLYLPTLPPDAPPPPLVVVPYPGLSQGAPSVLADYGMRTPNVAIIVGAGYAVLQPALPLAPNAEPAAGLGARVLAIVDAAAAQHPQAFDPGRMALWGHSFGGYGALVITSQTDRFRAAIAMAPPTDLIGGWGTFQAAQRVDPADGVGVAARTGWTEDAQGAMRGPPWRDPDRYLRNSPLFRADRIRTPLMLVTGDQDHIPMSQSEEMFSALYRQDRDAILLTYWGEAHTLHSPGNVRDAYARALAFLAEHLGR